MKQSYYFPIKKGDYSENDRYLTTRDHFLTGETFELYKHPELDMLVTIPQPPAESLSRYYESDAYISHQDENKGLVASLYRVVRNHTLNKKLQLIKSEVGGIGTLADLGAGTGAFLSLAKDKGWKVRGVEPNEEARRQAVEKGISLEQSIQDLQGEQFDVVTLWHVLEHLPDLNSTVEQIKSLVKPGGTLIIAVPNFKSGDAKHYKEFWAAYDTPRHLWHFSRDAMLKLMAPEFKIKSVKPMWFDAFYVSILSEKYRTGSSSLLKAFWYGLRSNLKGISTKQYSSLQYCFKMEK